MSWVTIVALTGMFGACALSLTMFLVLPRGGGGSSAKCANGS